ncbi:MAG: GlcNAc-transferase family protein, partial [Roseiarcus sp.]
MDAIYVQIPAYRDSELSSTLRDLYQNAARPERLRVRVMWQHGEGERLDEAVRDLPNLEIVALPAERSRGCNWARNLLQREWRGEPYTLLLDSHHRFARDWDDAALSMYHSLRERGVRKPLLTAYLPPYDPRREPRGRERRPYKIFPLRRDGGLLTMLT